jgi:phosphotransferase system enzyme I (PtsI)
MASGKKRVKLYGLVVSPGLARGRVCLLGRPVTVKRRSVSRDQIPKELERLNRAIEAVREDLRRTRRVIGHDLGEKEATIFDAQLLVLDDPYFRSRIESVVKDEQLAAETAIDAVVQEFASRLADAADGHLREGIEHFRDVGERLVEYLIEQSSRDPCPDRGDDLILVAEEITPTQVAHLNQRSVRGIVTGRGGATSHAAILARSLGVPMVTNVRHGLRYLEPGAPVIVDAYRGIVIVHPLPRDVRLFERRQEEIAIQLAQEDEILRHPSHTRDGREVHLYANIGSPDEVEEALARGAEGIGLYRTEIHFLNRARLPGEEEQFGYYRAVAEKARPRPVVIRTLDLGGDKLGRFLRMEPEDNPYLGLRAIRISLARPELFLTQIRALLRAAVSENVRILLPMVSTVEEVEAARRLVERAKDELSAAGIPFGRDVPLGAMIEVPSAAMLVRDLLGLVDFVSVGTNDLIQYTVAVDRGNAQVSQLYEPLNPAVLRLLDSIRKAADEAGKEVAICGEMAGDTRYTALLVGLGYQHLSMSPFFIPQVKRVILNLHYSDAQRVAARILEIPRIERIRRELRSFARRLDREARSGLEPA